MHTSPLAITGLLAALAACRPGTAEAVVVVRSRLPPRRHRSGGRGGRGGGDQAAAVHPAPPTPSARLRRRDTPAIDSRRGCASGCLKVAVKGETLFQCGPSW